jgi:hypothetical protein
MLSEARGALMLCPDLPLLWVIGPAKYAVSRTAGNSCKYGAYRFLSFSLAYIYDNFKSYFISFNIWLLVLHVNRWRRAQKEQEVNVVIKQVLSMSDGSHRKPALQVLTDTAAAPQLLPQLRCPAKFFLPLRFSHSCIPLGFSLHHRCSWNLCDPFSSHWHCMGRNATSLVKTSLSYSAAIRSFSCKHMNLPEWGGRDLNGKLLRPMKSDRCHVDRTKFDRWPSKTLDFTFYPVRYTISSKNISLQLM